MKKLGTQSAAPRLQVKRQTIRDLDKHDLDDVRGGIGHGASKWGVCSTREETHYNCGCM